MTLQGLDVSGYRNGLNIFEMLVTAWRLASRCPDRLQDWMAHFQHTSTFTATRIRHGKRYRHVFPRPADALTVLPQPRVATANNVSQGPGAVVFGDQANQSDGGATVILGSDNQIAIYTYDILPNAVINNP